MPTLPDVPGRDLLKWSWLVTGAFTVASVLAVFVPAVRYPYAGLSVVALIVGSGVFLLGFFEALDRSRVEIIALGSLYGLSGSAPPVVRRHLLGSLAVQVVVSIAAASVRPFTAVAFGILVPMLGLGIVGMWAARHGAFEPRTELRPKRRSS